MSTKSIFYLFSLIKRLENKIDILANHLGVKFPVPKPKKKTPLEEAYPDFKTIKKNAGVKE